MREIKFRGWDGYKMHDNSEVMRVMYNLSTGSTLTRPLEYMQYVDLKSKSNKDACEGDVIRFKSPYRTTQTHKGDNIPNGSYTEPMEPGIKTYEGVIVFEDYGFHFKDFETDQLTPLQWLQIQWDLEQIKEAISWTRQTDNWFDDPEEGDLHYLITECAKVETAEQLIEYLNGFEIIGNIYENHELLK